MRRFIFALAFAVTASPALAQDFPIGAAYRSRIIDGVSQKLSEGYFDANTAKLIETQLTKKSVRAAYDTLNSAAAFSAAMTKDLRTWSNDRHLQIFFSKDPIPTKGIPAEPELDESARRNFGLFALTRFTGNIGYIEIGRFDAASRAGPTIQAAMQFLANTDALIIDLRQNGGGHADGVAQLTSYFLAEQTKLATLERRDKNASDQVWSAPYVAPKYLNKPVFILTSGRTFSGAEGFAYDMKYFAKATIVGEKTRGGANPGGVQMIDEHFAVFVPTARVVHAATGTNWDANGIAPDVAVAAKDASKTALKLALEKLIATQPNSSRFSMWQEAYKDMFPAQ